MNTDINNPIIRMVLNIIQNYNHKKYWSRRYKVVNSSKKTFFNILRMISIKRSDAFHNASMGTDFGSGAIFATPPNLPHGLNGIIVSHYAQIGNNCTIFQQVTIAGEDYKAANIGNNVIIGAGAKIIGNVQIGDNVKIGANAVVTKDIPSNCTAVGVPARIIKENDFWQSFGSFNKEKVAKFSISSVNEKIQNIYKEVNNAR